MTRRRRDGRTLSVVQSSLHLRDSSSMNSNKRFLRLSKMMFSALQPRRQYSSYLRSLKLTSRSSMSCRKTFKESFEASGIAGS